MIARFDHRPMLTALLATIHDRVGRGGDNAGHVAHYGGASGGDLLERKWGRQPRRGRAGHRRVLRRRVEQLRTRRGSTTTRQDGRRRETPPSIATRKW